MRNLQNRQQILLDATVLLLALLLLLGTNTNAATLHNVYPEDGFMVRRIVLDAGHGGKDSGCLGHNHKEKDIALEITLLVGEMIGKQYPDVEVIFTRTKDKFIPLHERANIANKNRADLFISVHCNSVKGKPHVHGSETFVMGLHRAKDNLEVAKRENASVLLEDDYEDHYEGFDPNSPEGHIALSVYQNAFLDQSISFAKEIENNSVVETSRGVKQAGFLVLRNTVMPSVLIEAGFLSNKKEADFLASYEGQKKVAGGIVSAFASYKNQMEEHNLIKEMPVAAAPKKMEKKPSQNSQTKKIEEEAVVAQSKIAEITSNKPTIQESKKMTETMAEKPTTTSAVVQDPPKQKNTNRKKAEIQYVVQVASAKKKFIPSGNKWKQIADEVLIRFEKENYKYQVGYLDSYQAASQKKSALRSIGFEDAFVVAYADDRLISLEEALSQSMD